MSNARELAQIPSTPSGRRNLIINGAMQVAQRGTSTTGVNSNTYASLDRFKTLTNEGTFTVSQSSEAPAGFANSYKLDCTTADTSLAAAGKVNIDTYLEGQDLQQIQKGLSTAKQVTLSFWVKSSVTGTYIVELFDVDNSRHINKSYSISSADTWEKKEILIDADTTGAFGNDNGASLQIRWWLAAGSNWTSGTLATTWQAQDNTDRAVGLSVNIASSTSNEFYLTGVQLEVGTVATEFEHRSFGEELALCQRYFFKLDFPITNTIGTAFRGTTNSGRITLICPTPLRTLPSINSTNQPTLRFWWNNGSNAIVSTDGSISVTSNSLDTNRIVLSCSNVTGLGNNVGSVWAYSGDLEISAEL